LSRTTASSKSALPRASDSGRLKGHGEILRQFIHNLYGIV
jgi:hypothetical protein